MGRWTVILALVLAILGVAGTARADGATDATMVGAGVPVGGIPEFSSLQELSGRPLGTVLGTTYDSDVIARMENPGDFLYYSDTAEMIQAVQFGRIDAFCQDAPVARIAVMRNEGLAIVPEDAGLDANAVALPKGSALTGDVSAIIQGFLEDGTLDALEWEWCGEDESMRSMPDLDWPCENGRLLCAVDDATEPMSFRDENGRLVGLEVELAHLIAKRLGRELVLIPMGSDAIAASLTTGSIDMAIAGISITDERAEQFDLSPAYRSALVTLVTRDVSGIQSSVLQRIRVSFEKSFIQAGRGLLLMRGLGVTVHIAALASALGLVLGFAVALLELSLPRLSDRARQPSGKRALICATACLGSVLRVIERVFLEVPVVIVLFILRYVVFDLSTSSGTLIAIVGLGVGLAATTSAAIRRAVEAAGDEPWEVAYAMGYTHWQALWHVMLPLAGADIASDLRDALIQLVFDTSVVGLIAVYDITRMADLVRAHSTDALPVLIATSVAYLLLSHLLARILDLLSARRLRLHAARA